MNIQILSRVIEELSQIITGARVERVYEGAGGVLYLTLGLDRRHYILLLSPDRSMPRLHLVTKKPAAAASPHGFSLYLRGRAMGARITRVSLLNQDRIAEVRFSRQGTEEYRLLFELIGSASNIIVTDASRTILAVYYPVPAGDSVKRPLLSGLTYVPPEQKSSRSHTATPVIVSVLSRGGPLETNKEMETVYERLIEERSEESLRIGLRSIVKKALAKTERRVKALSADLVSSQKAEEYRQAGNLILANLGRLKTGQEHASLSGYDGETVNVRLDPKLSPARNADHYFKKYKKAKAGRDIIAARLRGGGEEVTRLNSFLSRLEKAEDRDALDDVRSDLVANGYIREMEKNKKRTGSAPAPFRMIEYEGWEILVGKSAAGNDYLTTKIARPQDLWLHAEGLPGSHVLIKNPGAGAIPPEVFARAASLAAFYSKGKAAGKVAVTYTYARHVKKPKGAKPGLVTLLERKTIVAVPETD